MGGDEYDDFLLEEDLPYEALVELEQLDAPQKVQQEATPQREILVPRRPSLKRHSTSATSNGARSILHDPSRHLRPPLSFGDTDFQELDAGVLDDGMGMDSVGEQNTTLQKDQNEQVEEEGGGGGGNMDYLHDGEPRMVSFAAEDPTVEISATEQYRIDNGIEYGFANDSFDTNSKQIAEVEEIKEQLEQVRLLLQIDPEVLRLTTSSSQGRESNTRKI